MRSRPRFLCFMWSRQDVQATERGPARRIFWRLYFIGWPPSAAKEPSP